MQFGFLGLPREIRNGIYEHLLTAQDFLSPMNWNDSGLSPELLSTNSLIYSEARVMLYSCNHSDLTCRGTHEIQTFWQRIGHRNASYIQFIQIGFPMFTTIERDGFFDCINVSRSGVSSRNITAIQSYCTGLKTVEILVPSFWRSRFSGEVCYEIDLLDSQLRAMPSSQEIVGEVSRESGVGNTTTLGRVMARRGWRVEHVQFKGVPIYDSRIAMDLVREVYYEACEDELPAYWRGCRNGIPGYMDLSDPDFWPDWVGMKMGKY